MPGTQEERLATLEQARENYIEQLEVRRRELQDELDQLDAELRTLGRDASSPPRPARPRRSSSRARRVNGTRRGRAPRGQRKREVLQAVRKLGPVGPSAIAKEVGIATSQTAKLLSTLRDEKAVSKTKDGWKASS